MTAAAINAKGTRAQRERWVPDLLSLAKIGAWAITEPGSGSDAFGSMLSTARRDGDEYVLNGSKTFITNGPYADTIVFICKLDEGNPPAERKVLSFVLDSGMPGLEQSKPLRKMGMHSSPTGQLFLTDVRVGRDRLIGETEDVAAGGREGAKATFAQERVGVAGMALGIIEQCLELSVAYAKDRVQFGQPIGEFQLIQDKLARMEVARLNVSNLVFRYLEMTKAGREPDSGRGVGLEAVLGPAPRRRWPWRRCSSSAATATWPSSGSSNWPATPRCCRSTPGTDEIQITHIARDLLRRDKRRSAGQPRSELMTARSSSPPEIGERSSTRSASSPASIRRARSIPGSRPQSSGGVHQWPSRRTARLAMVVSVTSPRSLTNTTSSAWGPRRVPARSGALSSDFVKETDVAAVHAARPPRPRRTGPGWRSGIALKVTSDLA